MKMAPIPPPRSRFAGLAPANIRAFLNQHSRIVNAITVVILVLVIANMAGWMRPLKAFFSAPRHHDVAHHGAVILNVKNLHCPAQYITAMVSDGRGGAYVASEDSGIYHYQPNATSPWTHYDKADSQGLVSNHIYSLCLDAKGRLWAGTLRHGVCVFNGTQWKHYGLLNGPLGCHVVAIVSDPYDHSVWMCTEAGVSIYETSTHQWRYLPQAMSGKSQDLFSSGLPPNPDCVAFNKQGVAFVGTQCHGLAIGYPPYKNWSIVTGPWKMPRTAFGHGLPCNLINAVAAGKDGRIYVGTDEGLAWNNPGNPYVFQYERGRDYIAKVKGLWHPPRVIHKPPRKVLAYLLPGDHVTCLAVDPLGQLWLGTWRSGMWFNSLGHGSLGQGPVVEMTPQIKRFDEALAAHRRWEMRVARLRRAGKLHKLPPAPPAIPHSQLAHFYYASVMRSYISAILPLSDGQLLVGHYGMGVSVGNLAVKTQSPWDRTASAVHNWIDGLLPGLPRQANMPAVAQAPTTAQLSFLYQNLLKNNAPQQPIKQPQIVPLTDDWRTQGTWLGRYGRYWACLFACGLDGGYDYLWRPGDNRLHHYEAIGPHCRTADLVQFHTTWSASAQKRVLELPEIYLDQRISAHKATWKMDRRETELDDHGETYPTTWQGPDLYTYLHIPAGAYTLSLYFFNKDGHDGWNRNRDYVVSAIPLPPSFHFGTASQPNTAPLAGRRGIAQSRIVNFWGGIWKRFLVRGPMKLAIRVAKNYSLNTILQAAMLDPLAEHPAPYYYGYRAWQAREKQQSEFRTRFAAAWRSGQLSGGPSPENARWPRRPVDDPTGNPSVEFANNRDVAMAADIMQALNLLEHRHPAVWAATQRLEYASVLRWCTAWHGATPINPTVTAVAERCYYHLDLFHRWELAEKSRGILTSRQIEKSLRFGSAARSCAGLAFGLIRWRVAQLRHPHGVMDTAQRLESLWWLLDQGEVAGKHQGSLTRHRPAAKRTTRPGV